jgi:hypothetical protein
LELLESSLTLLLDEDVLDLDGCGVTLLETEVGEFVTLA